MQLGLEMTSRERIIKQRRESTEFKNETCFKSREIKNDRYPTSEKYGISSVTKQYKNNVTKLLRNSVTFECHKT